MGGCFTTIHHFKPHLYPIIIWPDKSRGPNYGAIRVPRTMLLDRFMNKRWKLRYL